MDTANVVDRCYKAAGAGDWEGWLSLFDENVVVDQQPEAERSA